MAKKFYAVRKGRKTGVFATWALCQEQIKGFSGAEYKSFTTKEEAEAFCLGEQAGGIDENGQKAAVAEAVKADGDTAIAYVDGTGLHVLEHELGHGFGMTDFYGGEGELDGFPPGGFPGGSSLMMAGSSMQITDFDGWMLRYFWDKIHLEEGRFSY